MEKVVLITGSTGGIGKALSYEFAKHGHNLLLVSTSDEKVEVLKKKIEKRGYGVKIFTYVCNLAHYYSYNDLYNYAKRNDLFVEILINNAGFGNFGEFVDSNIDKENEMIDVNIKAVMNLTHLFLPEMVSRKEGKIVNVASIAAFAPGPYLATYYASKSYVLNFSYALASEVKKDNVKVLTLCPGTTETGFEKRANLDNSKLFKTLRVATPYKVGKYAYKKIKKNKEIMIYGLNNKILIFLIRFAPRKLVRSIIIKIQKLR